MKNNEARVFAKSNVLSFYLKTFETVEEALSFCKAMNWIYIDENDEEYSLVIDIQY